MLSVAGTRLYHEPLGRYGVLWNGSAGGLSSEGLDRDGLTRALRSIVEGREWRSFNWPHWDPVKRHPTRLSPVRFLGLGRGRIIIKDPTAVAMLGVISEIVDADFILVVRHPAAYASSLARLGWNPDTRVRCLASHLAFERFEFNRFSGVIDNLASFDMLERCTLQLALLVSLVLSFVECHPRAKLYRYGDLARDPIPAFEKMFRQLGLRYDQSVVDYHRKLTSGPQTDDLGRHDVRRSSRAFCDVWKSRLTREEVERVRRMWCRFELGIYNRTEDWE